METKTLELVERLRKFHHKTRGLSYNGIPGQIIPEGCELSGLAAKALAESVWQPIETAPKDGTHILVGAPFRKAEKAREGYMQPPDEPAFTAEACWGRSWTDTTNRWIAPYSDQDEQGGCAEYSPTHWMPLPPPPKP